MTLRLPIAAISFDIDHTLIDFDAVLENSLKKVSQAIASEFVVHISTTELVAIAAKTAAAYDGDSTDFLEIRRLSFENALRSKRLDTDFTETLFELFIEERFRKTMFMPGAEELLSNISKSIKVAVLSNGNSDPKRLGFDHYFDEIMIGKDLDYKKPHVGAFSKLKEKLDIADPSHILHIGDSLNDDVKGASEAGFRSVWFNSERKTLNGYASPAHEISHLSELLPIIAQNYETLS
jgi:putative hydrolase of the HAD superfamily